MKYVVLFLVWFIACHKPSNAQILPPLEDQKHITNIFVSQYGFVGNKKFTSVFCFEGVPGSGDKIYLVTKNNKIVPVKIPDNLIDEELTLISSGPKFFCIQTSAGEKWFYYFEGNRSGFLTKFADKKIRGHDGTRDLD